MVPRPNSYSGKNLTTDQKCEVSTVCGNPVSLRQLMGYRPFMDVFELLSPNCSACLGRAEEFSAFTWCDRCEIEVCFSIDRFEVALPK